MHWKGTKSHNTKRKTKEPVICICFFSREKEEADANEMESPPRFAGMAGWLAIKLHNFFHFAVMIEDWKGIAPIDPGGVAGHLTGGDLDPPVGDVPVPLVVDLGTGTVGEARGIDVSHAPERGMVIATGVGQRIGGARIVTDGRTGATPTPLTVDTDPGRDTIIKETFCLSLSSFS